MFCLGVVVAGFLLYEHMVYGSEKFPLLYVHSYVHKYAHTVGDGNLFSLVAVVVAIGGIV